MLYNVMVLSTDDRYVKNMFLNVISKWHRHFRYVRVRHWVCLGSIMLISLKAYTWYRASVPMCTQVAGTFARCLNASVTPAQRPCRFPDGFSQAHSPPWCLAVTCNRSLNKEDTHDIIQPIVESLEAVPYGPPRQRHLLQEMRILGTHYLLCTWCSVGPQFFFRRNYSLSRYNLVYSMEEVSSISSYVTVLHWNFCYVLDDPEMRTAFQCSLGNRWISSTDPRTSMAKGIYCTLGRVSKNEWLTFMEYFLCRC